MPNLTNQKVYRPETNGCLLFLSNRPQNTLQLRYESQCKKFDFSSPEMRSEIQKVLRKQGFILQRMYTNFEMLSKTFTV